MGILDMNVPILGGRPKQKGERPKALIATGFQLATAVVDLEAEDSTAPAVEFRFRLGNEAYPAMLLVLDEQTMQSAGFLFLNACGDAVKRCREAKAVTHAEECDLDEDCSCGADEAGQ